MTYCIVNEEAVKVISDAVTFLTARQMCILWYQNRLFYPCIIQNKNQVFEEKIQRFEKVDTMKN
jgi:hypothetical protein